MRIIIIHANPNADICPTFQHRKTFQKKSVRKFVNNQKQHYLCTLKYNFGHMIVTFVKEYLRELYETGTTDDKKHRFQPGIMRKYKYCISSLISAGSIAAINLL